MNANREQNKSNYRAKRLDEYQDAIKILFTVCMIVNFIILYVNAIASFEYADREVRVHGLLVLVELLIISYI